MMKIKMNLGIYRIAHLEIQRIKQSKIKRLNSKII
jgi:hypothetical protein